MLVNSWDIFGEYEKWRGCKTGKLSLTAKDQSSLVALLSWRSSTTDSLEA